MAVAAKGATGRRGVAVSGGGGGWQWWWSSGDAPYISSWLILAHLFLLNSSCTAIVFPRSTITVRRGVVASDDGRCSNIGRDALREGGHAVDASVAVALCLGVVRPASSGIGGGSFMLVRLANGQAQGFDMRGTAPGKASKDMYAENHAKKSKGALAIAIPGEIAGLYTAWKQYGKLSWKRLVEPAEQLARKGFKISKSLYNVMVIAESDIKADKGLRNIFTIFTSNRTRLLREGNTCRNVNLANTLKEISNNGSQALYKGSIAMNLVSDVQNAGGIITIEDLQHYQAKLRKPISVNIRGHRILGMPPATSGGAMMILVLNILAQYGFRLNVTHSLEVHRMVEALKHAHAVRTNLADPDFVDVKKFLSDMISPKFATELKRSINDSMTFDAKHYGARWNQVHDDGTTHICVVDINRNAVALTTSVGSYFGSKFLSESTGIVLNNEMSAFSLPEKRSADPWPPSPANFIQPSKRPLSSMSPTIVLKGKHLKAILGSAGGLRIPAATTEVFLNHFVKGMDPLASLRAPRFYHLLFPNVLYYEKWTSIFGDRYEVSKQTIEALRKKGHVVCPIRGKTVSQFVVQQLERRNFGTLVAASDPRVGGFPAGY